MRNHRLGPITSDLDPTMVHMVFSKSDAWRFIFGVFALGFAVGFAVCSFL